MRYHDYHLKEYSVTDFGRTITLHLVSNLSTQAEQSVLQFTEVACYRFLHTGGAIITDIFTGSLHKALGELGISLTPQIKMLGGPSKDFSDDNEWAKYFAGEGLQNWIIESAIGFVGFVVARTLKQIEADQSGADNLAERGI